MDNGNKNMEIMELWKKGSRNNFTKKIMPLLGVE